MSETRSTLIDRALLQDRAASPKPTFTPREAIAIALVGTPWNTLNEDRPFGIDPEGAAVEAILLCLKQAGYKIEVA